MADNITNVLNKSGAKIFFSGIGGISMSAIALALHQKGYVVYGTDTTNSDNTRRLEEAGIKVFYKHDGQNVGSADILVFNARIKADNPEMVYAKESGIPIVSRGEMLGVLMQSYETSIGIAGTHGKSSTTSMISEIFMTADKNPTFFIGAIYPPIDSAYKIGGDEFFILESDEYSDTFLNFYPNISVILNLEMDHPDYFSGIDSIIESFRRYVSNTSGYVVYNLDDDNVRAAVSSYTGTLASFSLKDELADYFVSGIEYKSSFAEFDIYKKGNMFAHIELSVPGDHSIKNAAASVAAADICGIAADDIIKAFKKFKGAYRRFEFKGTFMGADVVDDYAHHPTEIRHLLTCAKSYEGKKTWCVFQPHTYSRVKDLFEDYVRELSAFKNLIVCGIFSASEKDDLGMSGKMLADRIANAVYIEDFGEIKSYLNSAVSEGDLIIAVGAGDINKLSVMLVDDMNPSLNIPQVIVK